MLIGRLCHASNYSSFSMSIKRGMKVRFSKPRTKGFSAPIPSVALREKKTLAARVYFPIISEKTHVSNLINSPKLDKKFPSFAFSVQSPILRIS